MAIDTSQFHAVFFEESFEGLDLIESALLNLDEDELDSEVINEIFRAAHSIKGGSGTFGFNDLTDFTHHMETLLDEVRSGQRQIDRHMVDLLLSSVDVLRDMIKCLSEGAPIDKEVAIAAEKKLEQALGRDKVAVDTIDETNVASRDISSSSNTFRIIFKPHPDMLLTGNEPIRLIRELDQMGNIEVKLCSGELLRLDEIDPEQCYIAWEMTLDTHEDEASIREIFEWVEDDCELTITTDSEKTDDTGEVARKREDATSVIENILDPKIETTPEQEKKTKPQSSVGSLSITGSSIRVDTDKIDSIINLVGELVITQSMLGQIGKNIEESVETGEVFVEKLQEGLTQLEQTTRELQDGIMNMRMLPINFVFNRFPRLVRDLSKTLDKKIELIITGESTEVDKTVMEKIGDPIVHLVRNSLDHGLESTEERIAAGKPETGVIRLDACHRGGNIVITVSDDGRGLDRDKILETARSRGLIKQTETPPDDDLWKLIFAPGFSTAESISDVSGRGVGMDVVMRNINNLGGSVDIKTSDGEGTIISVRLPLSLSIMDGQLVKVDDQVYVVPLTGIVESLLLDKRCLKSVAGMPILYSLRDEYIPMSRLKKIMTGKDDEVESDNELMVVVEAEGKKIGIVVDDLLAQQQVVVKSLETNYRKINWVSGATILGDGTVALILDIQGLVRANKGSAKSSPLQAA